MEVNIFIPLPSGFCAGVDKAINGAQEVLSLIKKRPIYFYHEIVHNNYLIDSFIKEGAMFVNDINLIPDNEYVIFSAHGVGDDIIEIANSKHLKIIDLTCPLVSLVHKRIKSYEDKDCDIIYIGDPNHQESKGTLNRLSKNAKYYVIKKASDIDAIFDQVSGARNVAYISQTTLNANDVINIISILKEKFPNIIGESAAELCHATKNRQGALQKIIDECTPDIVIVIGSLTSSNSNKLRDVGLKSNIPSYLVDNASMISIDALDLMDELVARKALNIGLTAGASAPEVLINEMIEFFKNKYHNHNVNVQYVTYTEENIVFHLPKILRDMKKEYS